MPEPRVGARHVTGGRRVGIPIAFALGVLAGCADFSSPDDPTGGVPDVLVGNPSFVGTIAPVLEARCATGGCHTIATQQGELVLEAQVAYDAIVGVDSRNGTPLVAPGDAEGSWLVRMISPDPEARDNLSRMPLASTPLTPNQIENIRRWIEQGAARN
jgi:hypothetical protein